MRQRSSVRQFVIALFLVGIVSLIQSGNLLVFWGIQPNLVLGVFAALAFLGFSLFEYSTLLAVGVALFFSTAAPVEDVLLFAAVVAVFRLVAAWLPGKAFLNSFMLAVLGTGLLYLITASSFLVENMRVVGIEMVYNAVVAGLVLLLFLLNGHETRFGPAI